MGWTRAFVLQYISGVQKEQLEAKDAISVELENCLLISFAHFVIPSEKSSTFRSSPCWQMEKISWSHKCHPQALQLSFDDLT